MDVNKIDPERAALYAKLFGDNKNYKHPEEKTNNKESIVSNKNPATLGESKFDEWWDFFNSIFQIIAVIIPVILLVVMNIKYFISLLPDMTYSNFWECFRWYMLNGFLAELKFVGVSGVVLIIDLAIVMLIEIIVKTVHFVVETIKSNKLAKDIQARELAIKTHLAVMDINDAKAKKAAEKKKESEKK